MPAAVPAKILPRTVNLDFNPIVHRIAGFLSPFRDLGNFGFADRKEEIDRHFDALRAAHRSLGTEPAGTEDALNQIISASCELARIFSSEYISAERTRGRVQLNDIADSDRRYVELRLGLLDKISTRLDENPR